MLIYARNTALILTLIFVRTLAFTIFCDKDKVLVEEKKKYTAESGKCYNTNKILRATFLEVLDQQEST